MAEPRVIIVHDVEHVTAALEAASELHVPVMLQSAPDAIFYAGSLYLLHMYQHAKRAFPQVRATFVLDCSDAGAEAIAAMQMGHRFLRSSAPQAVRDKLADIASQCGVEMVASDSKPLDLLETRDARAACKEWLAGTQKIENVDKTG